MFLFRLLFVAIGLSDIGSGENRITPLVSKSRVIIVPGPTPARARALSPREMSSSALVFGTGAVSGAAPAALRPGTRSARTATGAGALRAPPRIRVPSRSGSNAVPRAAPESSASEPPPPWSALSVPVYSLATAAPPGAAAGDSASRASMNITTYCCPVTIAPSRRFAVALYTHTATARNALATGRGVLQILRQQHKSLVPLLGKQSAHDVDKLEAVQKQGFGIVNRHGAPTLADAYGVVALKIVSVETAGDHHLALCEVVAHETLRGEGEPLYTGDLPKT